MHHRVKKFKLNRDYDHRRSLVRSLAVQIVTHGEIETTLAKAKAIRPYLERMVTVAQRGDLAARRRLIAFFNDKEVARKLQE